MKFLIHLLLVTGLTVSSAHAQNNEHQDKPPSDGISSLSPELRDLLTKEMQAIEKGMQAIIPAFASGNWNEIAHIAEQVENSFILKRQLTQEQRHELHEKLPTAFIKQDQQFHYLAGMLAHAAKMEKQELVGFYFSELNNACVRCHSEFARHKFPAFDTDKQQNEHSH